MGLYGVILAVIALPLWWVAFGDRRVDAGEFFALGPLWIWIGGMVLAQAALLVIPVRIATRRPITKRSLLWPLLIGLLMLLILAAGMSLVAYETVHHLTSQSGTSGQGGLDTTTAMVIAFVAVGVIWLLWGFLFAYYCGGREPRVLMSRVTRFLVAGSVLELLVAVPAHVYARHKDDCCGGMYTVWGLAAGVSVMLFAFGPAIFVLFARRVQSLRPNVDTTREA
jgi:hypothetical protein